MEYIGNNALKEYKKEYKKKEFYIKYAYNKKEQSKSLPVYKFLLYFIISVIFFVLAGISLRIQSDISNCQRQIGTLEMEYTELYNENEDRMASINGSININDLKQKAKDLGMSMASEEQIKIID